MSLERHDRSNQIVRRYEDLETSYARYAAAPGALNREFVDPFETAREAYGGGTCRAPDHEPIERPAPLTLVGIGPDDAAARTVSLGEGDVASVDAGAERFRVKVYGQRRADESEGDDERIVGVGIDVWNPDEERWEEIAGHVETRDVLEWDHGDATIRLILADSPALGA